MTTPERDDSRILAVISAFRPPTDLADRARALLDQVERVIVVDDGSETARELDFGDERIELIELPANRGIASALNRGILRARELGATHVLVLDQDSIVPEGYVAALSSALWARQGSGSRVLAAVPATVEGDAITTIGGGDRPLDPIQSGQLLSMEAISRIGGFDERLVIDAVDSEYTLRARRCGYELYTVAEADLGHSLGELSPLLVLDRHVSVLGRRRYWRYHAPFRTYYMVRNGLALWRLHRRGNVSWLLRRTAYLVVDVTYTSLASPDRCAQFVAAAHALGDTLRRRLGRIPDRTVARIARRDAGRD